VGYRSPPDQIDNRVIFSLLHEYRSFLLRIYNDIFSKGTFPEQWNQFLMVLIPKPDANGFRPISLLSCLSKTMEKMLYHRIQWHIESQHIIPDLQLWFRPDRSCIDSLVILSCDIHKGFVNSSSTLAAFLDIKSAFDNVIPNILIRELENIGIPARVRMFILNLISIRSLHFIVDGNQIGPFHSYKGVPQGSILSPLLFNIYLKDISKYLHSNSKILLYADDIIVYSNKPSNKPSEALLSIQTSLNCISDFLKVKGLDLSPDKSRCMIFTRSKAVPNLHPVRINGFPISYVPSVKFLGIFLDSKMTGKKHLKYLIRKGSVIVDILTSLAGGGARTRTFSLIYIVLYSEVRSSMAVTFSDSIQTRPFLRNSKDFNFAQSE